MAARQRCYICNLNNNLRQMRRLGDDVIKREIASNRRNCFDLPPQNIQNDTRICCDLSVNKEIADRGNPASVRLNVAVQVGNRGCIICHNINNVSIALSLDCRVHIYTQNNIYIPEGVRCCPVHLDQNNRILAALIPGIRFINRSYVIPGQHLQLFLKQFRNALQNADNQRWNPDNLDDEEYKCFFSLDKAQFEVLYNYCDAVATDKGFRYINKKDLMAFLCKLRQGLSDEFLRVIFDYPTRQSVSMAVSTVRQSLRMRFVNENIGVACINREDYIARHVSDFANELYNENPNERVAIVLCDATYAYVHKCSHFQVLRQSYSMHKGRHLLKPTLLVAPNGYILAILGPYFSDSQNNDAAILTAEFEGDANILRDWFRNGDIILVDRGYRDCIPFLNQLGITYKMPALLERGQRQLSTEDANDSRIVTKMRWVVEARNGHFRSIYKMLDHVFNIQNSHHIGDYYRIVGALINRFFPLINMQNATVEVARNMLQRRNNINVVQARVEVDNLILRRGEWERLDNHLPDFPILDINYLRDLTIGVYQVNLAPGYIQDKLLRDDDEELQFDTLRDEPNLVRFRIFSRFRNRIKHQVFISYVSTNDPEFENAEDVIPGYYCTCQSGTRTLGTCAHVASILWYLGYARHTQNVKYPEGSLLDITGDAGNRA